MADLIFENAKLAEIYDHFDGERKDLQNYLSIAREFNVEKILDIGCGTGCFATLLSAQGYIVSGLDPAEASLNVAKKKAYADKVDWILGDTENLPKISVDMAVMTGNVAQVFIRDEKWEKNLSCIKNVLKPEGHLVFETRDPAKKAWLEWNREKSYQKIQTPNLGVVEGWCDLLDVSDELVSFRWTYYFESSGETISSDSTIRFRSKDSIINSLERVGLSILDIRDAPDRPGKEFVFIAKRIHKQEGTLIKL